ncbi:hypothetical protein YC2023_026370 [Brassica napus]
MTRGNHMKGREAIQVKISLFNTNLEDKISLGKGPIKSREGTEIGLLDGILYAQTGPIRR